MKAKKAEGKLNTRNKAAPAMKYAGLVSVCATGAFLTGLPVRAVALNLYNGTQYGNNVEINLTTTVSYTGMYRVNSPSAILTGPANANGSEGDINFRHGVVGNLFEAVPVLDVKDGDYGAHVSGQIYLNTVYLGTNQNNQPGTLNALYVGKSTDFTSATRNVDGENAQLLDAFVYAQHQFAGDQTVQLKVGRQVLFWGQSLYFPTDGISGGQAPINVVAAQNLINPQAQQVFMPVGQAVLTYNPRPDVTLQGYYQFEWEHDYLQGAGAYFNGNDFLDKGGQSLIVGNVPGVGNEYFLRSKDISPGHQNGQFGLSVQFEVSNWDFGLFGERFDAKTPEVYAYPGAGGVAAISTPVAAGLAVGRYALVYPRDIWLEGGSFSTNIGAANVAGEVSARENQPLATGLNVPAASNNTNGNPAYPVGTTLDMQLSTIYVTPALSFDPGGATVTGEVVVNHVLGGIKNKAALSPGLQGTAAAFDLGIAPTYYNVVSNLDVTIPVSITYDFLGRSEMDTSIYHGNGVFDVGVTGTYRHTWIASLSYQDYLGKPNTTYNQIADRGFVSLNLQHTF